MQYQGLSQQEAEKLQKTHGLNQITKKKSFSLLKQLWNVVKEPTFSLLIGIAVLYAIIGEIKDVIILSFAIVPIGGIQLFQNIKVDRTLDKLRSLMDYKVKVIRNGKKKEVASKYVVPGDIVYLTAGDKVPADGVVRSLQTLQVDESLLTGESRSVDKEQFTGNIQDIEEEQMDIEDPSFVFGGSLVVQGEGFVEVVKTGADTKYGEIGNLVQSIKEGENRLQKELQGLVKKLFIFSFILTFAIFVIVLFDTGAQLSLLLGGDVLGFFASGDVVQALLLALTMAIASIPEELPVIFWVFLIIGARKIAKQKALVRNMTSIESLGSANVICVDKTGTLTEGSLAVHSVYTGGELFKREATQASDEQVRTLIERAVLAGERYSADPIEMANKDYAKALDIDIDEVYETYSLEVDFSFDQTKKLISHVYSVDESENIHVFVGGAPEEVLDFCTLSGEQRDILLNKYREFSEHGYRVIGYASRKTTYEEIDKDDRDTVEKDLIFEGFVIMSDPVRAEVPEAVQTSYSAGIRLIMITGDGPETARSVANELDMDAGDEILTGKQITKLSDTELRDKLDHVNIFARILPEQKHRLVQLLQELDHSVAMTGDGVNDAPAIKAADVGLAMGDRGTEVAREAADIILLDDNFATIVTTIRNGRRIYDNLRKSLGYLILIHLAIFGLAFFVPILGLPVLLLPIHIITLELILDPLAVLGFEHEPPRSDLMTRPPRSKEEHFLSLHNVRPFIIYGFGLFIMAFVWYALLLNYDIPEDTARTMSFLSIVAGQFSIVIFTRNGTVFQRLNLMSNRLMASLFAITIGLLLVAIFIPPVANLFHFSALSFQLFALGVVISVAVASVMTLLVHDALGFAQNKRV